MITHIDLFSGIGGFAYAIDNVFGKENVKHIFCENDKFCQAIIRKHWPSSAIHGDIRGFTANSADNGRPHWRALEQGRQDKDNKIRQTEKDKQVREGRERELGTTNPFILTGGFPCQPFSQAGVRKGTSDDRYLWPEMLRVIRETKPRWVIAENVRGILTIQDGMVFEQVCSDLEREDYEVRAFIIPAIAVGAPHRRDRVWFVAHHKSTRAWSNNAKPRKVFIGSGGTEKAGACNPISKGLEGQGYKEFTTTTRPNRDTPNATGKRLCRGSENESKQQASVHRERIKQDAPNARQQYGQQGNSQELEANQTERTTRSADNERQSEVDWSRDWKEVAFATCYDRVDDGPPRQMDGTTISGARHRKERLKVCGNAIVPQVVEQILKGIKEIDTGGE